MDVAAAAHIVRAMSARDETEIIRKAQKRYLDEALKDAGVEKLTQLANKAGINPSTLTRFYNKKGHKSLLTAKTLSKIEMLTGRKAPLPTENLPMRAPVAYLYVRGISAAGVWRDVTLVSDEPIGTIPVGPLPKYAGKPQYALKIEGNSVNRRMEHGGYAVCVEWASIGQHRPNDGQFVHVERTRGGTTEVSIKRYFIVRGKPELHPYSDDPNHQKPIPLDSDEDDIEITIRGLVIGWFAHEDEA